MRWEGSFVYLFALVTNYLNEQTSINTYIPTRDLAHSSAPLAENTRDRVSARLPSSGPGHHPWTTRGHYPYQQATNSRNVASSPKLVIQKTFKKIVEKWFRILQFSGVYYGQIEVTLPDSLTQTVR